jgi:hypothetical protein
MSAAFLIDSLRHGSRITIQPSQPRSERERVVNVKANGRRKELRGFTESMVIETLIASLALLTLVGAAAHTGDSGNKKQKNNFDHVLQDR